MAQLPQRTGNHILETKSKKHFDRHVPDEWVVNEFKSDYGTDLNVEVAENNDVTGLSFSVQLKSKETEKNTGFVNVTHAVLSTSTNIINDVFLALILVTWFSFKSFAEFQTVSVLENW